MTNAPLVSVKMITYNHRRCIAQAIEGVIFQKTDFPFELVIGEDCSTDGTREIVFDYAKRFPDRIRVITSEQNVGMTANGRRARLACVGKYMAFCEGDDYWHAPDKLAKQVGFLEANPDYGMVHSHAHFRDLVSGQFKENAFRVPRHLDDANAYFDILTRDREIVTASVCLRKDLLDEIHRDCPECGKHKFLMGDTQNWLELARRAKVKCLHEPLVTKNSLQESATRSKDAHRVLKFALSLRDLYLHYLQKYECPPRLALYLKKQCALMVLYRAYRAMDREQAYAAWRELRALGGLPSPKAWLYILGVESLLRQRLVRPGLRTIELAERTATKIGLKSSGGLA